MTLEPGIGCQSNTRERINPYIREDLKEAKRVSINCWAEAIFAFPENGLTTWASEISDLDWFDDDIIRTSLAAYCSTDVEVKRYEPFTKLTNRIIYLARAELTGVDNTYPVNDFCFAEYDRPVDTIEEHEGLGAIRKPDILGLRNSVAKKLRRKDTAGKKATVRWTDILLPLEFKARKLLLETLNSQRLTRKLDAVRPDGIPVKPLRRPKKTAKNSSGKATTASSKSRHRAKTEPPSVKANILAPLLEREEYSGAGAADTDEMAGVDLSRQVASYALELLSCTYGTRQFCLSMTVKDDTMSFWYYDASGIIFTEDSISIIDNFEVFAAMIVGFASCTPEQFGLLPISVVRPHVPYPRNFPPPNLDENTLTISDPRTKQEITVTLDQSLFSQYILVGKRTFLYTIETSPAICAKKLIMKLSYQVTMRREEYSLVAIAKKAKVRHLPDIHLWGDLWKLSDGVRNVFLQKSEQRATYEDRVLRAIVYTRYSPIKPLFADNCLLIPVMVDQMLDCLHDLRYKANILHRDISANNIMYEKRGSYYHFVLIDFDMAVEIPKDNSQTYVASSKHRTGTLPFMAYQLIEDAAWATRNKGRKWVPKPHLLCHDFQSLFWVSFWCILMLFRHYLDKPDQAILLKFVQEWESGGLGKLATYKSDITRRLLKITGLKNLPGPTVALDAWLHAWSRIFRKAGDAELDHETDASFLPIAGEKPKSFDEETIGGTFTRQILKDALTPFMPFKQDAIIVDEIETDDVEVEKDHIEVEKTDVEVEKDDTGPTENDVPRDRELPQVIAKDKPRRQARKRARPQEQEVAAENDIRARLRPRRKVVYGA